MAEPPGEQPEEEEKPQQPIPEPSVQASVTSLKSQQSLPRHSGHGLQGQTGSSERGLETYPGQDEQQSQIPYHDQQPGTVQQVRSNIYQPQQPRLNVYEQQEPRGAMYQPQQARGSLFQGRGSMPQPQDQRSGGYRQDISGGSSQDYLAGTSQPQDLRGSFHQPYQVPSVRSSGLQYDPGHGPYQPHEPGLGLYQIGAGIYEDQVPDPGPRTLAIKNAKAYLLKTSIKSGVSL